MPLLPNETWKLVLAGLFAAAGLQHFFWPQGQWVLGFYSKPVDQSEDLIFVLRFIGIALVATAMTVFNPKGMDNSVIFSLVAQAGLYHYTYGATPKPFWPIAAAWGLVLFLRRSKDAASRHVGDSLFRYGCGVLALVQFSAAFCCLKCVYLENNAFFPKGEPKDAGNEMFALTLRALAAVRGGVLCFAAMEKDDNRAFGILETGITIVYIVGRYGGWAVAPLALSGVAILGAFCILWENNGWVLIDCSFTNEIYDYGAAIFEGKKKQPSASPVRTKSSKKRN